MKIKKNLLTFVPFMFKCWSYGCLIKKLRNKEIKSSEIENWIIENEEIKK